MAIVPISSFSLIIGAIRNVRAPARSTKAAIKEWPSRYGGSDRRAPMCTTSLALRTSAWPLPGGGRDESSAHVATDAGGALGGATSVELDQLRNAHRAAL